jgi:hypothetical protein
MVGRYNLSGPNWIVDAGSADGGSGLLATHLAHLINVELANR